jgi:hypothetical protein
VGRSRARLKLGHSPRKTPQISSRSERRCCCGLVAHASPFRIERSVQGGVLWCAVIEPFTPPTRFGTIRRGRERTDLSGLVMSRTPPVIRGTVHSTSRGSSMSRPPRSDAGVPDGGGLRAVLALARPCSSHGSRAPVNSRSGDRCFNGTA